MSAHTIAPVPGCAARCRRRTPTFPSRWATYFDFSPWGGGYMRTNTGRGAVVLASGVCGDLLTGQVYADERFVEKTP